MVNKARERAKQPEVTEANTGCFSGWGHKDGEAVGFRNTSGGRVRRAEGQPGTGVTR